MNNSSEAIPIVNLPQSTGWVQFIIQLSSGPPQIIGIEEEKAKQYIEDWHSGKMSMSGVACIGQMDCPGPWSVLVSSIIGMRSSPIAAEALEQLGLKPRTPQRSNPVLPAGTPFRNKSGFGY
jgi:hypothetical protein